MGNCASLKKSQRKSERRTSLDGGSLKEITEQRRPSKRSADSLPYGNPSSPQSEVNQKASKQAEGGSGDEIGFKSKNGPSQKSKEVEKEESESSGRLDVMPSEGSSTSTSALKPGTASSPTPSNTQHLTPKCSIGHEGESNVASPSPEYIVDENVTFDALFNIKGDLEYMIAISTRSSQLSVWSIYQEKEVRVLKGITQPKNVQMIDRYTALVLCNRELRIYNLDEGVLKIMLKGVMNQKMPFFGLHDHNYVVALSRNRMYVNMINIHTGNMETTFKVGEDRFLNSLLVSENGKICVCGDETQKPFPLLVWDLSSRKLIYDLRIPHHEFITSLSALSHDGHYVVCVSKELTSSSPNFIVVYDLQNGTLFKKWKPEHNTTSITISTSFVINSVENYQILVWDLSTGNNKYTLMGHTGPINNLQISDDGTILLSTSLEDNGSVRVWNMETGESIKVVTPENPLSCCRLSLDGKAIVLCYKNSAKIDTVILCHKSSESGKEAGSVLVYGSEDRTGMEFKLEEE